MPTKNPHCLTNLLASLDLVFQLKWKLSRSYISARNSRWMAWEDSRRGKCGEWTKYLRRWRSKKSNPTVLVGFWECDLAVGWSESANGFDVINNSVRSILLRKLRKVNQLLQVMIILLLGLGRKTVDYKPHGYSHFLSHCLGSFSNDPNPLPYQRPKQLSQHETNQHWWCHPNRAKGQWLATQNRLDSVHR